MSDKMVLVIEDDELNLKLVREVLRMGRFGVLEAMDAMTGILLARQHHPDLILMDIHLPDMDGLSATRVLRGEETLKTIPVIALTALAMQGDREKALEAGCCEYMTKPFRIDELLETVRRYVQP